MQPDGRGFDSTTFPPWTNGENRERQRVRPKSLRGKAKGGLAPPPHPHAGRFGAGGSGPKVTSLNDLGPRASSEHRRPESSRRKVPGHVPPPPALVDSGRGQ